MHAHVGMKANDVHAHQLELNAQFVPVLKSVKTMLLTVRPVNLFVNCSRKSDKVQVIKQVTSKT